MIILVSNKYIQKIYNFLFLRAFLIFKDRNLQIEVGDIVPWSDRNSPTNGQDLFITQLKLQKPDFSNKARFANFRIRLSHDTF